MMFHLEEDTLNEFNLVRELITTLYDFSEQISYEEVRFDSNALCGTLSLIKDQLDSIASKMTQTNVK